MPRRRIGWKLTAAALVLLGVAGLLYAGVVRPQLLIVAEIRNHMRCQVLDAYIGSYFEMTGHYPLTLLDAVPREHRTHASVLDNWGHEFYYHSDGTMFVLVSYGRDGQPDGSNYLAIRATAG